ncbi:LysR family transcriptional regulator [Massilia norwichensis]|uniref:LysR family transcriptional regulator n=1 Tax=Massilia norwichensis TaxID=1442366 RepID=A0ABT2A8H9_9BURK|nr:LysR family transcriptional regulator [Massilia norwichensis]
MPFSSDSVRVFLAVLDHGSFSAAARALGRVPSAVSLVIAQLEAELDLPLFDRSTREPRPTDAARALEPRARHVASQLRQLEADALSLHRGLERRLRISIVPELVSGPWTAPLAVLAQEFPSLEVEVLSAPQADALRLLHEGAIDLAMVFERERLDERETFEEVGSDVMVAILAPGFAAPFKGTGTLRVEDLLDLRQIAMTSRHGSHHDSRLILSRHVWRTDSPLATLNLVEAGLGWALLPRAMVQAAIKAGTVREIDFGNASNPLKLLVDIVWSRERPQGLGARRFIALMKEAGRRA